MRRGLAAVAAVVVLAACGQSTPLSLPSPDRPTAPAPTVGEDPVPEGVVRVAYPDEPASFVDTDGSDPAAVDLVALWGLPLFRVDEDGQRVAVLAEEVTETTAADGAHTVTVSLREGVWSDGTPVTAADVVATVEALRPSVPELTSLLRAVAIDDRTVALTWDRVVVGWWQAVDAVGTILPAAVLAEGGLAAYRDAIPVSGGPFSLATYERGLSLVFRAHPGSPAGAPASEEIEVLVSPSFETSLGLLEDGRVDATLGHVALNPVPRGEGVAGAEAAAPLGGTTVTLEFRADGGLGSVEDAGRRRGIVGALRLEALVEGLLGSTGTPAIGPWAAGPAVAVQAPAEEPGERQLVTVLPRGHEVIGFTARAVQRDLEPIGVDMQFVSFEAPDYQREAATQGAATFRVRREPPRPLLSRQLVPGSTTGVGTALAAFAGTDVLPELQQVADEAFVVPLYRVGAAHVWRNSLDGFVPSSWPGLAFTSATEWRG